MSDYFIIRLSITSMFILATIIFAVVCFRRRDLISWLFAYVASSISETFRLISQETNDVFYLTSLTFSTLTLILIIIAVSHEYYQTFYRSSKSKVSSILLIAIVQQIISIGLQMLIGILLLIALYLILRIYLKKRTPTHAFLCFILICGILNLIAIVLRDAGLKGAEEFFLFSSIVMATNMFLTGIVARIEERLVNSEKRYRLAYSKAEFYKDLFVHDINNILQNLEFSLEIISQNIKIYENQKEVRELINIAKTQVNRGANLGLSVRKLSDLEGGEIQNKPIEVCDTLRHAIAQVREVFQDKEILINIDSNSKKFHVKANELLYEAFRIILNNAIRYNDNPIKEVLIKISKDLKDGINYIKMEFIDNGVGLPDEMKKSIFPQIFAKPRSFKRIGLGLLLVQEVIKSFNGKIWVEDRVNGDYKKGSNFILLIPETS